MVTLVQDEDFRAAKEAGAFFFWKESRGCDKVPTSEAKGGVFRRICTLFTHPGSLSKRIRLKRQLGSLKITKHFNLLPFFARSCAHSSVG